jgi:prephenate dehydrogenase
MGAVADDPPFARIGIVGLGLIGGSIALGVRTAWPQVRLLAVDRPEVLEMALARGAIDDGRETVGALGGLDALILAAPIGQNVAALEALPEVLGGEMVVTDVGSTKRRMLEAAVGLPPRLDFVPGHPLGGAARSGFAHARGTPFHERPWILTPRAGAPEPAVTRVEALARGLGARPMRMAAGEHDRVMAFVSHLPQIVASGLMDVTGREVAARGLALAGGGLGDTTRLASSAASVWRDVCATNADAISEALDALGARIAEVREQLAAGEDVGALFDDAARWRDVLTRQQRPRSDDH